MNLCKRVDNVGYYSPDHEPVGFIYTDRRETLVPWDEPAEAAAFVYLELLDSEFAIYEGYYEIAV